MHLSDCILLGHGRENIGEKKKENGLKVLYVNRSIRAVLSRHIEQGRGVLWSVIFNFVPHQKLIISRPRSSDPLVVYPRREWQLWPPHFAYICRFCSWYSGENGNYGPPQCWIPADKCKHGPGYLPGGEGGGVRFFISIYASPSKRDPCSKARH